jgi:hypothetical protein
MFDEIAIVDKVHRLAFVDAWRPPRNVAGDALPAIENVEFLDACLGGLGLGKAGPNNAQHCGRKTNCSIHVASPRFSVFKVPAWLLGPAYYLIVADAVQTMVISVACLPG